MHGLKLMKDSLWRLFCGASITVAAVGMLFAATSAGAACGDPLGLKSGVVPKLPFLVQLGGGAEQAQQTEAPHSTSRSISGTVTERSLKIPISHPLQDPSALEYGSRSERGPSASITLGGISTSTGIRSEPSPSTKPTPSLRTARLTTVPSTSSFMMSMGTSSQK